MTKRQTEEAGKYCLQISLLALGSMVFNSFAQASFELKLILSIGGLTLTIVFLILGMYLFKEVK